MSNGGIIGPTNTTTIGVWSQAEQYAKSLNGTWGS